MMLAARVMAVDAVCCELVSEFPVIREKYRVFVGLTSLFRE